MKNLKPRVDEENVSKNGTGNVKLYSGMQHISPPNLPKAHVRKSEARFYESCTRCQVVCISHDVIVIIINQLQCMGC